MAGSFFARMRRDVEETRNEKSLFRGSFQGVAGVGFEPTAFGL